jgi:beta-lactamase class A
VFNTFSFAIVGIQPIAVSAEPPQLALMPNEEKSALLTVYLRDDVEAKTYPFILRTFSHLNILERTEIPLKLEVQALASAAVGQTPTPGLPPSSLAMAVSADGPVRAQLTGPIPIELAVDHGRLSLTPGAQDRVNLVIQNSSGSQLSLELIYEGLPDTWISLSPALVSVAPRNSVQAIVALSPPRDVPSGSYPLAVGAQVRSHAAIAVRLNLMLQVGDAGIAVREPSVMELSVNSSLLTVAPGADVEAKVTVQNLTNLLDQVEIHIDGVDPAWVELIPLVQTFYPLAPATARILIHPPQDLAQSVAGIYPLVIRSRLQENAGQEGRTTTDLEIQLVGDYEINLVEKEARATQEASYAIQVGNKSNAPLQLRLHGSDFAQALAYKFDPLVLSVPPANSGTATLTVRARQTVDQERTVPFSVSGQGQFMLNGGARVATASHETAGQFVQLPLPALAVWVEPPQIETTTKAKNQYEVHVRNPSPRAVRVRLTATDDSGNLDFQVKPSEFELAPEAESSATLIIDAKNWPGPRERWEQALRVTATPAGNAVRSDTAEATLVQFNPEHPGPSLLERLLTPALLALLALGLFVLGFFIIRDRCGVIPDQWAWAQERCNQVLGGLDNPRPDPTIVPTIGPTTASPGPSPSSPFPEQQLRDTLASAGGTFGTVVYDLTNDKQVYAQNEQEPFRAASVIKLPIVLTVYHMAQQKQLDLNEPLTMEQGDIVSGSGVLQNREVGTSYTIRELCNLMLSASDNTAGNMILNRIRFDSVNALMEQLGARQTQVLRLFLDEDAIAAGRDNWTSPADIVLILQGLERDDWIGKDGAQEILEAMKQLHPDLPREQTNLFNSMLPKLLPLSVEVGHKSGTWDQYGIAHDVGIVYLPEQRYIIVMMGRDLPNNAAGRDAIAKASLLVYNWFAQ